MLLLLGAGPLQGPPLLITQQEQTGFPAEGQPPDIPAVSPLPRMMHIGGRRGPPILITQTESTVFPAAGQPPDTMNVLTPPRLMGLGVIMGGPPVLVQQGSYVPVEQTKAVEPPITHPLVKFRLARGGRIGPVLLTQQVQHQAGPLNFVLTQAGTLAATGTLVRAVSARVSGALTSGGALIRSLTARMSGALTAAGVLVRGAQIVRQGVLATASAVARAASTKMAGALATASQLLAGKVIKSKADGSLAMTGVVASKIVAGPSTIPSTQTVRSTTSPVWDGIIHGKGDISSS